MSPCSSEPDFERLATQLTAMLNTAADNGEVLGINNERLGGLFASIVRIYAEKVQNGEPVRPTGGNSSLGVTDVCIACTALMEAVDLELFELGGWQTMSGLGRIMSRSGDSPTHVDGAPGR